MDRFDRILGLHKIFSSRRTPITRRELEEKLESNRSTIKRTIEDMRNFLNAPITYDRTRNGYYYDQQHGVHPYEIPGLWFNSEELYALLTTQKLLSDIQPGLLDDSIKAFRQRIEDLLKIMGTESRELARRIKILQTEARPANSEDFRKLTTALLGRRRVNVLYHGRQRDRLTERMVSPQRLIYYRDNWYLDGWCHLRKELRTFSLDRIKPTFIDTAAALECNDEALDEHFTRTFGIYAGPATATAHLTFSSEAAKWVADEHWHPQQQGRVLPDGRYELKIPYGNPTELIREILKFGPDVEVIAPPSLRRQVSNHLLETIKIYQSRTHG